MKNRAALIVAVLGTASSVFAQAQTQGSVTYTLSWSEFHTGSNGWINAVAGNATGGVAGVVEPALGEGALFKITMAMSGTPAGDGSGSALTWDPTLLAGSSGSGTLSGFWGGTVDLVGDGGAASASGTWSDNTTAYATATRKRLLNFTDSGDSGTVVPPGSKITNIQPSQFGANAANLNHANNVAIFQGLWIPAAGPGNRTVNWNTVLGSLGFLSQVGARDNEFDNGFTLPVALNVSTLFGAAVNVPVSIPGPASLALLGLGGLVAGRRRR